MTRLDWDQVAALRMRRHGLVERAPAGELVETVRRLGGLHAQLTSSAELSAFARLDGLTPDAVSQALWEDRTLVKTWAMRGTLHLLPADEFAVWTAVTGTYKHFLSKTWQRAFVATEDLERIIEAAATALTGPPLTREALADAVTEATDPRLGDALRESWGMVLKPAAFRGRLCFGPPDGQRVTFTRPDRWLGDGLGPVPPPDADAAIATVFRRFLAVNGPASREDVARHWRGAFTPAQAAKRLAALGDAHEHDGRWTLADDLDGVEPVRDVVRLLPAFDPYVTGATLHAEQLMPGPFADRVYRAQGWVSAVVLVDGRMAGTFKHERKGRRLELEVEPFVRLAKPVRAGVEAEAERLAGFLGGELALQIT